MRTLRHYVDLRAREQPDAPYLIAPETGATLTYGQLQRNSPRSRPFPAEARAQQRRQGRADAAQRLSDRAVADRRDVRGLHGRAAEPSVATLATDLRARSFRHAARLHHRGIRRTAEIGAGRDQTRDHGDRDRSRRDGNLRRRHPARRRPARYRRGRRRAAHVHLGHHRQAQRLRAHAQERVRRRRIHEPRPRAHRAGPRAVRAAALSHQRPDRDRGGAAGARRQRGDAAPLQREQLLGTRGAIPLHLDQRGADPHRLPAQRARSARAQSRHLAREILPLGLGAAAARAAPRVRSRNSASASSKPSA